jgi:hypothetical protein
VATIVLVIAPLVLVLYLLIAGINRGEHYTPQAYYRSKRGGAPVAFGYESLGPRRRRHSPGEDAAGEQPAQS